VLLLRARRYTCKYNEFMLALVDVVDDISADRCAARLG